MRLNVQRGEVEVILPFLLIPSCFKKSTYKGGTKIVPFFYFLFIYLFFHPVSHINISPMAGSFVFKHHILLLLKTECIKNLSYSYFQM